MYLATDQLFNQAAYWYYMFGGRQNVPITVRACISRAYGQGAQHSQSPISIYTHIPGLKVVCPATPYDATGLLVSAVRDDNPVMYIDDAWLYLLEEEVPDDLYEVPLGKAAVCRQGSMITIVGISYLLHEAMLAAGQLAQEGIDVEVIDPRTLKPFDFETVVQSVKKTGRLLVAEPDFPVSGFGSYICQAVTEELFSQMKSAPACITFPDLPASASHVLEDAYYPSHEDILKRVRGILSG